MITAVADPPLTFKQFVCHDSGRFHKRGVTKDQLGFTPIGKVNLLILMAMDSNPEGLTATQIAEVIEAPSAVVYTALWRMHRRGLIRKVMPPTVPYKHAITLEGRKALAASIAAIQAWEDAQ